MTDTDTALQLGRRVTPTGRYVLSIDAPRDEWLQLRRSGIAATDVVAIMGQSRFKTAFDVWCDKTMPAPADDTAAGEAAFWGTRLEEPVAQAWAERTGVKIRRVGLISHETDTWMLASLDRLVTGCPDGRCALEVKTRSLFVADDWERELPQDVRTQCLWQLLVSGLDHIHVAALIGGQRLVEHTVHFDLEQTTNILKAATAVWEAVKTGEQPDLPAELWTDAFLDQRHPERAGQVEVDAETIAAAAEYADIVTAIKALEGRKDMLRTRLVGALGDHDTATCDGHITYTYKASDRRTLDSKLLVELHPDVAADERLWKTTTTRTLRLGKEGRSK